MDGVGRELQVPRYLMLPLYLTTLLPKVPSFKVRQRDHLNFGIFAAGLDDHQGYLLSTIYYLLSTIYYLLWRIISAPTIPRSRHVRRRGKS